MLLVLLSLLQAGSIQGSTMPRRVARLHTSLSGSVSRGFVTKDDNIHAWPAPRAIRPGLFGSDARPVYSVADISVIRPSLPFGWHSVFRADPKSSSSPCPHLVESSCPSFLRLLRELGLFILLASVEHFKMASFASKRLFSRRSET